jgi:hypothetical protein
MATKIKLSACVVWLLTLSGCATLDKVKSEWNTLIRGETKTTEEKRLAFVERLANKTLIELCLEHDKEMRWGYLSRRDYVFIEISEELKRRGEDPLVCRKTSEHSR